MKKPRKTLYQELIEPVMLGKEVKSTYFIDEKFIIRATRKLYGKKIAAQHNIEITLTIGKPNYVEREYARKFKKIFGKPVKDTLITKAYKAPKRIR